MTADITVSGDWTAIGKQNVGGKLTEWVVESATPYTGTFDGGGYTLTLSKNGLDSAQANVTIALFHTVGTDGVIRNVNLNVSFEGYRYIAGAAVYNYGTIEYVTVSGRIAGTSATGYAAGIASYNGCKTVNDVVIPGKILHCVNSAEIDCTYLWPSGVLQGLKYGGRNVGGICADFLGEMRYCANFGDIWVNNNGSGPSGGSLFALRTGLSRNGPVERLIVSDCYNAGTVYIIHTGAPGTTFGGLFGSYADSYILPWLQSSEPVFNISNVFNYGLIENPYPDKSPENVRRYWNIIGFGNNADLLDYYIADIFSNVYYRPEIGGRLFGLSPGNGDDGYGTERVKSVVHSKTTAEFKTAELAALLNNGRVAADAPWEYVAGADYPTLKFERADYDPALDLPPPPTYDHITAAAGYGGTIARNDEGLYTVTPAAGYVIDKIWVDGKQLEGVSGLSTYTTAATPERSIFATFIAATTNSSPALIILDRTIPAAATATATDKAAPTAPKKLAAPTAKAGKKQLKITWKKSSAKGVSGYQVQYRVVGAGQEWEMEKLGAKAMSLTIKKLKPGKIYELRVRAAKKSGGKTAYGSWSKTIKSGKVKQ